MIFPEGMSMNTQYTVLQGCFLDDISNASCACVFTVVQVTGRLSDAPETVRATITPDDVWQHSPPKKNEQAATRMVLM